MACTLCPQPCHDFLSAPQTQQRSDRGCDKSVLHECPEPGCVAPGKFDCHAWRLQVIQGLDWVRQHYAPPAVVVMALGGDSQYALDMAVRNLALAGVPVVVAAGNEDTDACAKSPARSARDRL